MHLSNGQPHPFEIPELCSIIASHLDLHDFTQLCLVSKDFSQLFRPFLWSEIILEGYDEFRRPCLPWTKGLKQNGHLIRRAELCSWFSWDRTYDYYEDEDEREADIENNDLLLAETLLAHCGTSLTSLKIEDISSDGRIWRAFLKRIRDNRTLEGTQLLNNIRVLDINLTYDTIKSKFLPLLAQPETYPEAMAVFARVEELRLKGTMGDDDSFSLVPGWRRIEAAAYDKDVYLKIDFWELARLFPSLRKLTLERFGTAEDDVEKAPSGSWTWTMATAGPEYYPVHTLDLQKSGISAAQLARILRRTYNIRSLKVGYMAAFEGDAEVLLQSLPKLVPCLTEYEQEYIDFSDWSTVFPGLGRLTHLSISNDALIGDDGLRTLAESCPGLHDLVLYYCYSVTHHALRHILRSCTQLKILRLPATPVHWGIFEKDVEIRFKSLTNGATAAETTSTSPSALVPWACQDSLRELLLALFEDSRSPELELAARRRCESLINLRSLELT
ncbi:hypothetical protein BGZ72_005770 [Mortierella alpina]|nr:hypothetical protein BGZ72_005770 [Mortierella alpina]